MILNNRKTFFLIMVLLNIFFGMVAFNLKSLVFEETILFLNFICIFIYFRKNLFDNIVIIMYYIFLFTFILYIPFSNLLLNQKNYITYSTALETNFILIIGFIGLLLGIFLGQFVNETKSNSSLRTLNYSKAALYLIIVTAPFAIVTTLQSITAVDAGGYLGLYQNSSDSIISRLGNFNLSFIYIFLATVPKKKLLNNSMFIIIPLMIMDIFTGRRGVAIVNIMVLITYYIIRSQKIEKINLKINFKFIFSVLLISGTLIFASVAISQLRLNESVDLTGAVSTFFKQQASMFNHIEYVTIFKEELKSYSNYYSLQALYNGTSLISNLTKFFIPQLINDSNFGNNLGNAITFLRDPIYYSIGGKFGTSYLAELYLDYGYIGLIIYNLFVGLFISTVSKLNLSNWIVFSFVLFLIRTLYFLPRESTFNWVNQLVSTTNITSVLIVLILGTIFSLLIKSGGDRNKSYNNH